MSWLNVTYDDYNFYVDFGDYYTYGLTESKEVAFNRNFIATVSLKNDFIEVKLKDGTIFRVSLTQINNIVNIITTFNGQSVTDLTVFYNQLKVLIR